MAAKTGGVPKWLLKRLTPEVQTSIAAEVVRQRGVKKDSKALVAASAAETEAVVATAEGGARAKILASLPWVLGGLAIVGVLVFAKSRTRRNPARARSRRRSTGRHYAGRLARRYSR